MINRVSVYNEAKRVYGEEQQTRIAMEELCEASVAISHFKRGKISKEELVSEFADAIIVIEEQLQYNGLTELIADAIDFKVVRLADRIVEEELSLE